MPPLEEQFHELMFYSLSHPDPRFIHQNVVDAYAAQTAHDATKNITIVFALIGLYLSVEKDFSGRQVQKAHMKMAEHPRQWPRPPLPKERGSVAIADVLSAPPGHERDAMIHSWCASVWEAWRESRDLIREIAREELAVE
jgi:hypothetical protein